MKKIPMRSYRKKIYSKYITFFQNSGSVDKHELLNFCKVYTRYFRKWLPNDKNAFILDAGCGSGKLLHFFSNKEFHNIYGVDISSEQISLAKKINNNVAQEDVIGFLESRKTTYDLITAMDLIEHFDKQEALGFIDACAKGLRSGGRLILQTPNAASPWGMMCRYGDITHETAFTPELLKKLLTMYGFSNVEYREAGPVAHGVFSIVRFLLWKVVWSILACWNFIETGDKRCGIYTRVFLISGEK